MVIGMNSIAAYCIAHLFDGFIGSSLDTHLGEKVAQVFGPAYQPLIHRTDFPVTAASATAVRSSCPPPSP